MSNGTNAEERGICVCFMNCMSQIPTHTASACTQTPQGVKFRKGNHILSHDRTTEIIHTMKF